MYRRVISRDQVGDGLHSGFRERFKRYTWIQLRPPGFYGGPRFML